MTESSTKQIIQLLEQLGSKLGATGSHLYEVLVRQGQIEALKSLVSIGVLLFIALVSTTVAYKAWRLGQSENWCDADGTVVVLIVSTIMSFLLILFTVATICSGDWYLYFNPEMYPLRYLRDLVR